MVSSMVFAVVVAMVAMMACIVLTISGWIIIVPHVLISVVLGLNCRRSVSNTMMSVIVSSQMMVDRGDVVHLSMVDDWLSEESLVEFLFVDRYVMHCSCRRVVVVVIVVVMRMIDLAVVATVVLSLAPVVRGLGSSHQK